MIRLKKHGLPKVLEQNATEWTRLLLERLAAGTATESDQSKYRHVEVKQKLVEETSGKCAYCESKLRHVAYGDIEHISPKSTRPEKSFAWDNLTLACDVCNTNKKTIDDLIDPYSTEPSDHIRFVGSMALPVPGSDLGLRSVMTLELNRLELLERRSERLSGLNKLLHLMVNISDAGTRLVLRNDLERNEIANSKEYAAMAREYISQELKRISFTTQNMTEASR